VAFFNQLLLELKIIFHDAVVHHHDLAGAVAMGMGILFRGPAMRGPAGVANPIASVERL
jgi:hypothetical protein